MKFIYPKSFKNKKYPEFIRNSKLLKTFKNPIKVFPRIGLPNEEVGVKKFKATEKYLVGNVRWTVAKINRLKVCFSSNGPKGFWDIATMSMRGISSCMRWDSKQCSSLQGSIVDPYTAVIYITDQKTTKYGNHMIARAVVRFVSHGGMPAIFLEGVYVTQKVCELELDLFQEIFLEYFESKVKVPILGGDIYYILDLNNRMVATEVTIIPITKPISKIRTLNIKNKQRIYPYRDSNLRFYNSKKFYNPLTIPVDAIKR